MKKFSKGLLSIILVLTVLMAALPVSASVQEVFDIRVTPSVTQACVGDVIEYTVTATGNSLLALEFQLAFPEGLRYVAGSAVIPDGVKELLGWPEVDWTEDTQKWSGYNHLGVEVPADTVLLTFCAVAEAEGTHEVILEDLLPYGGSFSLLEPTANVGSVEVRKPNPTKVTGLMASNVAETTLTLSWDPIEGATKYWVYLDGAVACSTTDATAALRKLKAGTAYEAKVTARLADGTVLALSDAEAITVKTLADEVTLPTVTATADDSTVTLSWSTENCAKAWVYLGTSKDSLKLKASSTTGTYTASELEADTTYYFQLSFSVGGKAVMSQEILEVKTAPKPVSNNPTKVTGLKAAKVEETSFTVTWDAIEGATKYWVYADGTIVSGTAANTASITKRTPGTSYEVKVTARLADGTVLALSDAEAITVKTLKNEIVIPVATATVGENTVTLTWDAGGCTKAWIYLGTSEDSMELLTSNTQGTYTVTGLRANTQYYIQLSYAIGGKVYMSETVLAVRTQAGADLAVNARLSGSDLVLEWKANENSYKYWVTVVRNGVTQVVSTTATGYTVPDFDPATCTVSIRGINSKGTYDYDVVVV